MAPTLIARCSLPAPHSLATTRLPTSRLTRFQHGTTPVVSASGSDGRGAAAHAPVVIVPGFLKGASSYRGLANALESSGCVADVAPVSHLDWYPTLAGRSFSALLQAIDYQLQESCDKHGRQAALVAHSAGGWLCRILLGDEMYNGQQFGRSSLVHTLVTLGTPHSSLEAYPFGRVPESRAGERADLPESAKGRSLQFANHFYPRGDSFPGTRIVCVAGKSVQGVDHSVADLVTAGDLRPQRLNEFFAFSSYKTSCGRGDVWGDGITPLECAHLPGAENIVLEGVFHNPGTPGWYGDALPLWAPCLLEASSQTAASKEAEGK